MIREDFHVHTVFSDGKDTPEDMVLSAIARGMTAIGFSDHSTTPCDQSYCMAREARADYVRTVRELARRYHGQIEIYCGIERDYDSEEDDTQYDYVIGSVHYLKLGEAYYPVDERAPILTDAAKRHFGGDVYALTEAYYQKVAHVVEQTNADIIGHFDLISKFIEQQPFFDVHNERYIAAWKQAADALLATKKPFEINTGAISRGYRTTPYPAQEIIRYLHDNGAAFVLSSDSHSAQSLLFGFAQAEERYPFISHFRPHRE